MNRDQKAVAIAEIAAAIDESQAIFAVDYRGISVAQVGELRARLRDADASFTVVKNSLTERAADQASAAELKAYLSGPTALTFVRGDVATAAKAIADYGRITQLLPFKGGMLEGAALDVEQLRSLSRLPSREALYGQLVGVVASPVSGLVRTLNALIGGLASALGQLNEKKESGEAPAGAPPAPPAAAPPEPQAEQPEPEAPAEPEQAATPEPEATGETEQAAADGAASEAASAEPAAAQEADEKAEPAGEPADNDQQADAAAEAEPDADATPPKED